MAVMVPQGAHGEFTAVDIFCGGGGVSDGLLKVPNLQIVAALNHSAQAIAVHSKAHPEVRHIKEDVRNIFETLPQLPRKANVGWASAECTNYSRAKGGQSRKPDSRSLPEYLEHYIVWCDFDMFVVENVTEFMDWGPLEPKLDKKGNLMYDKKGDIILTIVKELKGILFERWKKTICSLGYEYKHVVLNAADFGVPTIRKRYFGVFVKQGLNIEFPIPTHSKDGSTGKKWVPCKEHIDFSKRGESIFGRTHNKRLRKNVRRPLKPATLRRIAYGIEKYSLKDFIMKYYGSKHNVSDIEEPIHTITTKDRHYLVEMESFITQAFHGAVTATGTKNPIGTIVTKDEKAVVTVDPFILKKHSDKYQSQSIEDPIHTVLTADGKKLVSIDPFLVKKNSGKYNVQGIDEPAHTIMTKEDRALLSYAGDKMTRHQKRERLDFFKTYLPDYDPDFLAAVISDIKFRYLTGEELAELSGFEKGRFLGDSQTQIKYNVGNAVPPELSNVLVRTLIEANNGRPHELGATA